MSWAGSWFLTWWMIFKTGSDVRIMKHFITYIFLKGKEAQLCFLSSITIKLCPISEENWIRKFCVMQAWVCVNEKHSLFWARIKSQTLKATCLQHQCCVVKPLTFSTCFPTFPLPSSNLPTLFACLPPTPIVSLSHADQKNFRATSKYPASNAGRGSCARPCLHWWALRLYEA